MSVFITRKLRTDPCQVVEGGHDDYGRLGPLRAGRTLLRAHVAVALGERCRREDRLRRREVGDVGGGGQAGLQVSGEGGRRFFQGLLWFGHSVGGPKFSGQSGEPNQTFG